MRVIVCGSRKWSNAAAVYGRITELPSDTTIIEGNASGADRLAAQAARALGMSWESYSPAWIIHGRRAGVIRNQQMLDLGADLVLAFWDGRSRGTADMIRRAKAAGVPVEVHTP